MVLPGKETWQWHDQKKVPQIRSFVMSIGGFRKATPFGVQPPKATPQILICGATLSPKCFTQA
jgi:hypothetical protein